MQRNIILISCTHDGKTNLPIEGVTVILIPANISTVTDERGHFIFNTYAVAASFIQITSIGFENRMVELTSFKPNTALALNPAKTQLQNVTVKTRAGQEF